MIDSYSRSDEVKNLLNPAFCGLVMLSFMSSYQAKNKNGIPVCLVYVLLPMILHADTRRSLPSSTRTKFHVWLKENEKIKIGLSNRIKNLKPFVSESIIFLFNHGLLEITEKSTILVNKSKVKKLINDADYISEYTRSGNVIGGMVADINSDSSFLALIGVCV